MELTFTGLRDKALKNKEKYKRISTYELFEQLIILMESSIKEDREKILDNLFLLTYDMGDYYEV